MGSSNNLETLRRAPVRRLLVQMQHNDPRCSQRSLSFALALDFLGINGSHFQPFYFRNLEIGAYRYLRDPRAFHGDQMLMNYRSGDYASLFNAIDAQQFLDEDNSHNLAKIKNQIVLIGVKDNKGDEENIGDIWQTPYGPMPGVFIHAHATSQLLSHILDDRPLLQAFPKIIDHLLILCASVMATALTLRIPRLYPLIVTIVAINVAVSLSCFLFLWIWGTWLPLVPVAIAFTSSSLITKAYLPEGRKM